jgi:hypothetical protein
MVGPPEQAKNNATEMKLPFISYGHYEGRELVTKHVDSVLMLSGIDPNNDMQGSIDGSTIYRTVDMSHSLLIDPDGCNAMLGYGRLSHI